MYNKFLKKKLKIFIMKRKGFFLTGLICLFCVLAALTSCKKNRECTGIVHTYTLNEGGIKVPVGGCELVIGDEKFAPEVYRKVVTDANGYYEGTWSREAYLLVEAKKPFNTEQYYHGIGYIHLETGNVTELSLQLELRKY